ncbi:thiamine-phosphate kinase [Candidatus Sumerlaeota bacterium]|nr:thiamine-phosphate kinase [Candidatus Sumerlaeota bacterium]
MKSARARETLADWGELRFLDWVRRSFGKDKGGGGNEILLSIGDDAAHLRLSRSRDIVVTTDALIEDVHFARSWIGPGDLGRKALVASLSDLAAMGAMPIASFLSLGVPASTAIAELKAFFRGLCREGRRWSCALAGGDLVRSPQWTINLTLIGRPGKGRGVIRRSTARPGQTLYVTGFPGQSAAGLAALERNEPQPTLIARHTRPTPRLREAEALRSICGDLSMIDLSDGIMTDASHVARASGVGLEIEVDALPVSPALKRYARHLGVDPLQWALYGGEDYELMFTSRRSAIKIVQAMGRAGLATRVTAIGRVVASPAAGKSRVSHPVRLLNSDGESLKGPDRSFNHFS